MILHSGVGPGHDGWKGSAGPGVRESLSEALGGLQSGAVPSARLQARREGWGWGKGRFSPCSPLGAKPARLRNAKHESCKLTLSSPLGETPFPETNTLQQCVCV